MGIPESQLSTWSHQGAIAGSRSTYATVKSSLESATSSIASKDFSVFLQGSYGNDTNIYAESDVDIVLRLNACFQSDRESLNDTQKTAWNNAHPGSVSYGYSEFKADVKTLLIKAFPGAVSSGDKAFSIAASGNRRKTDVLPCIAFRRYSKFNSVADQSYSEGICFYDKAGTRITNYPKQHSVNLTTKHQSSGLQLKPMIRTLKNLREWLIANDQLEAGVAPSYYLEGLLYNVPDEKFVASLGDTFSNAINWIQQNADKSKLVTVNEQFYLLRDNVKTCWPKEDAETFLNAAIKLWNEW